MDKYEYSIKADKIKKLVDRRDYATAVKIADTIDWERIRNAKILSTVSLAYEKLERYEDAKEILLIAYESAPVGRRFLYRLTELAVKEGKLEEAETYLKEFAATSPKDPSRLLLQYEIAEARQEPLERLIMILEAYQKREFEERWSYELAVLYYRAGKQEECVKLCDEIVLWFGVGPYVDKALELKQGIQPLTPEQVERKEHKEKYLRQLEDIQKEFEKKEQDSAYKQDTKSEQAPAGQEKKAAGVKDEEGPKQKPKKAHRTGDKPMAEKARDEKPGDSRKVVKLQRRAQADDTGNEPVMDVDLPAGMDRQSEAQQEPEMGEGLAKEIEAEAMSATLTEIMLRETAATMEEVGAVNNDHSDTKEKTKVATERFTEQTREFAREAFVINEVLKEVTGQAIAPQLIEEKLRRLTVQSAWGDEDSAGTDGDLRQTPDPVENEASEEIEAQPEEEAAPEEENHCAEEDTAEEEVSEEAEPELVEEEASEEIKEEPAEEPVSEETEEEPAEEPVSEEIEEESAENAWAEEHEHKGRVTVDEMLEGTLRSVAAGEKSAKEARQKAAAGEPEAEMIGEPEADKEDPREMKQIVQDHYILVASTDEESGLQRGVRYIREARLHMENSATQIAKITGQKLATRKIVKTMRKLQGRDLIISGISELPDEILLETIRWMAEDQVESFIVLLDTRKELDQLIARKPYFASCEYLTEEESDPARMEDEKEDSAGMPEGEPEQRLETEGESEKRTLAELVEAALQSGGLEAYQARQEDTPESQAAEDASSEEASSEEANAAEKRTDFRKKQMQASAESTLETGMEPKQFVETATQYAHMLDTVIDEMGELALFALAEDYVQEREPLTEELAQEVVEKAILRAEKRSLKSLFSNRYDKDGYLILKEKHFKED